jgi:hypothetical protein
MLPYFLRLVVFMKVPEVSTQPLANQKVSGSGNKDLPCDNGWSVCINAGKFDSPLEEFTTKRAAKRYFKKASVVSKVPIELIPSNKVRRLQGYYITDDILISLKIK